MSNKRNARRRTPDQADRGREIAAIRTRAGIHIKFPGREQVKRWAIDQSRRDG